ncbi:MAG: helix-turn-helix domain-containing protein [Planctomycetaceae bacterium]|nr:helix-turn-helix domain-containing protein [Planctomycetaceae bacterium]
MPPDPRKPWLRPMQYTREGEPPEPRDRPPPPVPSATVPAKLLDVVAVADLLGVCERSVWRWTHGGRLPAPVTIGRVRRWRADVIARWIDDNCPRR